MPPAVPALPAGVDRRALVVALGTVYLVWGSVYLAIRLVINEVDPFQAMAQRFLLAGLLLAGIVVVRRGVAALRVTRRQMAWLAVLGVLLLGLGNGLQALGQHQGLPSGVAALLVASVPAWAVLLRLATGDHPAPLTLLGVALGFAGLVVLVVLGQGVEGRMPIPAVLLTLGASLAWTLGSWLQGRVALPADVFTIATYQQLVAAACAALLALGRGERFSIDYTARGWAAMAYLVLACSIVGFVAFAWLLTSVPLSLTATHAYVNPVVAVLLGWVVLAEPIGAPVLLGGGVVVGAVVLIVSAERPRGPADLPDRPT